MDEFTKKYGKRFDHAVREYETSYQAVYLHLDEKEKLESQAKLQRKREQCMV
jgi:hypothetical protein